MRVRQVPALLGLCVLPHVNARKHLELLASGVGDHLAHAACRLLMALELRERTAQTRTVSPASAAADLDQMLLFAGEPLTRQT
jgi:hypothetical protein